MNMLSNTHATEIKDFDWFRGVRILKISQMHFGQKAYDYFRNNFTSPDDLESNGMESFRDCVKSAKKNVYNFIAADVDEDDLQRAFDLAYSDMYSDMQSDY